MHQNLLRRCDQLSDDLGSYARIHRCEKSMEPDQIALGARSPSKRHDLSLPTETFGPSLDAGMVNEAAGIDVRQAFQSELMTPGFEFNPFGQGLLDDPSFRAVEARSDAVDLLGEIKGNMGGNDTRAHQGPCQSY